MRLVVALIQPAKLQAVQEALAKIGVDRLTVCDAQGFGQQRGQRSNYRGVETTSTLLRKVALEIAVNEDFLERTVETIARVARTGESGNIGDGKIFVLPFEEVIRLSDTVRGPEAVS
jgi:nitrogen regulatory protein P-II 1